jgi:hypothetical protein
MDNRNVCSLQPSITAASQMREFCVAPEVLKSGRSDKEWIKVPARGEYYREAIERCWDDIWGETCSMIMQFPPVLDDGGKQASSRSCLQAQNESPESFNYTRRMIESQPWTLT